MPVDLLLRFLFLLHCISLQGGVEKYTGLDRFVCREKLWKDMEVKPLLHVMHYPKGNFILRLVLFHSVS